MTQNSASKHLHGKDNSDRLELLLFNVGGSQPFGINVLKVKEVIACPALTAVPQSHPAVKGVAHLRGEPLTVMDLALAIGRPPLQFGPGSDDNGSIIITEFNRSMQGFLVKGVDRIVVCDWKQVLPPPKGSGTSSYITGVTEIDDRLVQILDVEKVLGEVVGAEIELSEDILAAADESGQLQGRRVMVVDDSSLARTQTVQTLSTLGIECVLARDGREALAMLQGLNGGEDPAAAVEMVISDIEMPEMDGYTLTTEIRNNSALADLYVLLHTSLNGAINTERANKVGANAVLTKFVPEELAKAVHQGFHQG
jgi:two-component system chemotaxis response regulator CheV